MKLEAQCYEIDSLALRRLADMRSVMNIDFHLAEVSVPTVSVCFLFVLPVTSEHALTVCIGRQYVYLYNASITRALCIRFAHMLHMAKVAIHSTNTQIFDLSTD